MYTHYASCSVYDAELDRELKKEGAINFQRMLHEVEREGYRLGENMFIYPSFVSFLLDSGNLLVLYVETVH